MGFFSKIFGLSDVDYCDKDFDKQLKRCEKQYKSHVVLKNQLRMAYCHNSIKSAFWWYENSPVKPNSGSDEDIEMLHAKFKCSLEPNVMDKDDGKATVTRELQEKFVTLVMPDIDYAGLGLTSKEYWVKQIMVAYDEMLAQKGFPHASPFYNILYWTATHPDKMLDKDGNFIKDESGKTAFRYWREGFDEKIFKYDNYRAISLSKIGKTE